MDAYWNILESFGTKIMMRGPILYVGGRKKKRKT